MRLLAVEPRRYGSGSRDRYRRIEELGADLYVLHGLGEPGWWPAPRYRVAGSRQIDDLAAAALDWHREVGFAGVLSFAETSVVTVAALAERLGLPGVGLDAARISRNKLLMRLGHRRAGAPHPEFRYVTTLAGALAAGEELGYPAVLKPTLGAASNFVSRVDGPDELRAAYPVAEEGSRTMPAVTAEAAGLDLGPPGLLLESYLDGAEHLIEACVWDGEVYLGSIVDRLEAAGRDIDENVHCAPTALGAEDIAAVRAAVAAAAAGQLLRRSALQVEVRFHGGRPYLVEVGARIGGGGLDLMGRLSAGYDPIACLVDVARGVRPALRDYRPTGTHTAAMVLLSGGGVVERVSVPPDLRDVFLLKVSVQAGDVVRRPPEGNDILGFLGTTGATRAGALNALWEAAERIDVRLDSIATPLGY